VIIEEDIYLEHFGVKGMKWGVRKSSSPGLTEDQAVLATYGAAFVTLALVKGGMHYLDSGIRNAKKSKNIPFKENPKLKGTKSVKELEKDVVSQINPNHGLSGTKQNCRRATMAYEMRRRGYDVKATKSHAATGQETKTLKKVNSIDKKKKYESIWGEKLVSTRKDFSRMPPDKKANEIFSALAKQPNGARGELCFGWYLGGGHSLAYEIINKKPVIFDTQANTTYASTASLNKLTPMMNEAAHTRLDNTVINEQLIRRWVSNV
jgi:hypothetical protein